MIHILSEMERMSNLPNKNKLKRKGKKFYRSSNSSVYRVPTSRRLTRLLKQKKIMRKLAAARAAKT